MKKLFAYLLMVATCYGVDYQVNLSDLNNAEWVEVALGDYRILWSDIGATPASILEFEWLFTTLANDTSGNGYDGMIIGATRNDATNGMSANYDLANATNSISATMGNVVQSLAWWGNTNGTWRYYEWIGGTQRVNNAAEAYTTNEWFEIDGNDFSFTGSDFDVAQARGYNAIIDNEVGITNRTELGANLGIISDYLADNTNTYWQDCELYVGFNNIIQDGSPNGVKLTTASAPTPKGTTAEGWADFDGNANDLFIADPSSNLTPKATGSTWSLWFNADTYDGNTQANDLIGKDNSAGTRDWIISAVDNSNNDTNASMYVTLRDTDDDRMIVRTDETFLTGEWYHLAVTDDGTGTTYTALSMYVNGELVSLTDVSVGSFGTRKRTANNCGIGCRENVGAALTHWNGDIDEVYIINRSLTSNEVFTLYNSTTNTHAN